MQVTVTNNNGVIAEKMECGDVIISAEGVRKVGNADCSVNVEQRQFAFMMRSGHTQEEIDRAMDGLRVACAGQNAHVIARKLLELNKAQFIQISDEKPSDVYGELCRVFGELNVSKDALSEALRRER